MRRAVLLVGLLAVACTVTPPANVPGIPAPARACVAVHVHAGSAVGPFVDGAAVSVGGLSGLTQGGGYFYFYPLTVGAQTIHVEKDGYVSADQAYAAPAAAAGACDVDVVLVEVFHPLPRLRARGQFFELETGERFTAIEASDFNLYGRFLNGEDIAPVLQQRQDAGFNMRRVWTRHSFQCRRANGSIDRECGVGESTLAQHPDYYDRLPAFLRLCAKHGAYVELTAYIGPGGDFDVTHWDRLVRAVRGPPASTNVLLELVNENDIHPIDLAPFARPGDLLASHGSNGSQAIPIQPFWDYATFHTNGAPEEQRKVGHNAMELSGGPVLANETSRYPDAGGMWAGGDPIVRATDAARAAALLAAGSCFHSSEGKNSTLWSAQTATIAKAWATAARGVPLDCQDGGYRHRDDLELGTLLRMYQRGRDDRCLAPVHP